DRYGGTAGLGFRQAGGTVASPTASNSAIAQIRIIGYGTTGFSTSKVAAEVVAAGTWTDTAQGTMFHVYTTALGSAAAHVRFRVTAGGHIAQYSEPASVTGCGAGATLTNGFDSHGVITEGTAATGCTLTFGTPYLTPPTCTVSSRAGQVFSYVVSNNAITITNIGALSSTTLDYTCHGW